jgi:hypothetical protein
LLDKADNYTYNRLAKKFAGLNPNLQDLSSQGAPIEQISSVQARIISAQESIQTQRQTAQPTKDNAEQYFNEMQKLTGNNTVKTNQLELFKNVVNDPRFNNISQKPVGMNDLALLKLFPNIRGLIENNPSKENLFLDNLSKLSNSLNIRTTNIQPTRSDSTNILMSKSQTADTDTKKLVSASFLNMIGNNQGLVDALAMSGPRIFVGNISNSGSGGWYSTDKNMILPMIGTRTGSEQINLASFSKVASHELGHWIDHADGNIDGFSSIIGPGFQNLRNEVHKGISLGSFDHLNDNYEKYSTSNPQEFFAVMGQFFVNNPIAMKDDIPEMYGLFSRAFNMDTNMDTGLTRENINTPIVASLPTSSNIQDSIINKPSRPNNINSSRIEVSRSTRTNTRISPTINNDYQSRTNNKRVTRSRLG